MERGAPRGAEGKGVLRRIEHVLRAASIRLRLIIAFVGLLLLRQEQPDQAESYFQRVSRLPNSALTGRAQYYLGLSYWQQQKLPQARAALERAAQNPGNPHQGKAREALRSGALR